VESAQDVTDEHTAFAPRCISLDLEVGRQDGRIHRFAAVRGDTGESFVYRSGDLSTALAKLDAFANGSAFLLGHNIIAFDALHLASVAPDLQLLKLPQADTLRLNPLAFPRNPYHRLVKHYQDGQLRRGRLNDPELDARLTLEVFSDQCEAFRGLIDIAPELLVAWHWLTTRDTRDAAMNAAFSTIRRTPIPTKEVAVRAILQRVQDQTCATHAKQVIDEAETNGWPLAYALAWLSVAGGNSVMPPWVRHQFPRAASIVRLLRETPCPSAECHWCRDRHDAGRELTKWFGFPEFRAEPADASGKPLQRAIVEAAMRGEHVLGILPTGTGKSLCYQIPALSRNDKTGALTVVISPLVALMADQVRGLEARGITSCAAVNGLLSMPERADVLDRVRLGDISILIISPEQLRSKTVRKVLAQREIGSWVLDEAHCFSKWGHDFRPDYRYVARFIRERSGTEAIPPILLLTATAKPDVVSDIIGHFREKLGVELRLLDGGASRTNLDFAVVQTTPATKLSDIYQLLTADLPSDVPGGAIVYCATRKQAEDVADYFRNKKVAAGHFHGALSPEIKKTTQEAFIGGELRVIAATNAFGMGIDKPDVRLVIHADIPGSLENYIQEAGRAGRDRKSARCVLMYTTDDVERQFGMSARSRLKQTEIQSILRALRRLESKKHLAGEVIATTAEILGEDEEGLFVRDSATEDTRVRTAVSWLEEAALLSREENDVKVFASSLRVQSIDEARAKLAKLTITDQYRGQLLSVVEALLDASADDGVTTDELMGVTGLSSDKVRAALYDLERVGIASNDMALTAFVHAGVERSSQRRLSNALALEAAVIAELRTVAPELGRGESSLLQLRAVAQHLRDQGIVDVLPEKVWRVIRGLAADGRGDEGGVASVRWRRVDAETLSVTLQREWDSIDRIATLRRAAASVLLQHLLESLAPGARGTDVLAATTLGKIHSKLEGDALIRAQAKDLRKLGERALMWLHEMEVIRLNKGLAVFRSAMTIRLSPERRAFVKANYEPLRLHYSEQTRQVHIMAEYAQRGLQQIAEAVALALDYFALAREAFLRKWLPDREKELLRETSPESWARIVESLGNRVQEHIVTDDREQTNVLVLAGPGSGKTRVLVHRIAYLIRVRREDPRGIIALAYNRHAAVEIRRRLSDLIGADAKFVTVLTCHALAMRLAGVSFANRVAQLSDTAFDDVLEDAIKLLRGEGLEAEEADAQRERLLAGFRWIFVDEYQDVGPGQYELISALAGRTRLDDEGKLSLFAVGDDDQNVYAFAGASVQFIRRFESDYSTRPSYLIENYRSTQHIIAAANLVIGAARDRMKAEHPITIDSARSREMPGGRWQELDPVALGRVQVIPAGENSATQAVAIMAELERLAGLDSEWRWTKAAVIAREWKYLEPVRSYCEEKGIPVHMANEDPPQFWRLRETQLLYSWLRASDAALIKVDTINEWLAEKPGGPWWDLLREAVHAYALETAEAELPAAHFIEWLAEWGREVRRRQSGLMLLTAHRAKGLEFDHVAILDGGWDRVGHDEDADSPRRLYYVAMTRARHTLVAARFSRSHAFLDGLPDSASVLRRSPVDLPKPSAALQRSYVRLSLKNVYISFAGHYSESHAVHRAIAALAPGDALQTRVANDRWELTNLEGTVVGRLAAAFEPPARMQCVSARVVAIGVRMRDDAEPEYQQRLRVDRWETVIPELVFAPEVMLSHANA
jgi:ATP-dependent DNA helicase RecQ